MTSPLVCFMRLIVLIFFFFNHQTAYEMRISDWSSDVCTSDLAGLGTVPVAVAGSAPVAGSEVLFQNTVLPARAKPTMVSSEVTRMTVQTTTIDADSRALSSTSSLPRKPVSGGMPVMPMAARKNRPARRQIGRAHV